MNDPVNHPSHYTSHPSGVECIQITGLHCGNPLPTDTSGRGGKQANRKFCSAKCKDAHRNAARRTPAKVPCKNCGRECALINPSLAGDICRACAAALGSAAAAVANTQDAQERFMRQVEIIQSSGCWEWQGTLQKNGYSTFGLEAKSLRGHRWSYEHFIGPIPEGLQIDHLCRNRSCVNPEHLEPVTARENSRRAMRASCVNGHPFSEENTYMHGGRRYCRTCRSARNRARYQRTEA